MRFFTYYLKDICDIKSGKRLPANSDFSKIETQYRYIRARDIKNGKISENELAFLDADTQSKIKKYIINEGDIAITIVANIGDVGYCTKSLNGANLTENAVRLTNFDKDKVDSKFLNYYLSQPSLKQYMENLAAGAAQAKLGIYKINKIKVLLPDVDAQKQIAYSIEKYDYIIENNNKRIKILEEMAENLYKEWFVRFRFPGYENTEFENGIPKGWVLSEDENKIQKPKGWYFGELNDIASFVRGKNITSSEMIEGEIPVISAGLEPSGYHNKSNVLGQSITVSSSGANAGYLSYHLSDIWAADCSYYNNQENLWFIYNTLKFLQPVISNLQVGAAQPHVYAKNINKLSVIIPEEKYISMYCQKVKSIYLEIKTLQDMNGNLEKQRDVLLPKLMSGKLEI